MNNNLCSYDYDSLRYRFQSLKKMCFICNNILFSDNNIYNMGCIGHCKMDCAKERLIEWSKYYGSDKSS